MAPSPRPPPALLDEIVEEILLRFPPDDPKWLLRVALVCKRWCRIISDRGFGRRFREFHRTPPMLGFLGNLVNTDGTARFVPACSFRPAHADRRGYRAHDSRHGRVLLNGLPRRHVPQPQASLAVWDPITEEQRRLPFLLRRRHVHNWNAAVLCAATGACDHLDCHPGPFLVVFVGIDTEEMFAHVYSSESGAWGEATSAQHPGDHLDVELRGALAGNALHFVFLEGTRILKYDLGTREMSLICLPRTISYGPRTVLMTMENGGLGFAEVDSGELKLWSMETGPEGNAGWALSRVIELKTLLLARNIWTSANVVAVADGVGVIFLRTIDGLYTFDLKSDRVIKVFTNSGFYDVIPYISFYTPVLGLASTGEGPSAGASSA